MAIDEKRIITSAWELMRLMEDLDVATVKFFKRDGSVRIMKCTINLKLIPKDDYPKGLKQGDPWKPSAMMKRAEVHHQVRAYDLDVHGWRTINFDTAEWVKDIKTNTTYRIQKIKK